MKRLISIINHFRLFCNKRGRISFVIILAMAFLVVFSYGIIEPIGCGGDNKEKEDYNVNKKLSNKYEILQGPNTIDLESLITEEPLLDFAKLGPTIYNMISNSGKYVYIPTSKWIDILNVNCKEKPRDPQTQVPIYNNNCVIKRINYPNGYVTEDTKPAYEYKKGRDYIYLGWTGGHIARIDVTNPRFPNIKVSTFARGIPPHLVGSKMVQIILAGNFIITKSSPVKMSPLEMYSTWYFPSYVNVWNKKTLEFLGSIAARYWQSYSNTPLAALALNPNANPLSSQYPVWPYSFKTHTADLTVALNRYLIWINNEESMLFIDLNDVNFNNPPTEVCVTNTNYDPNTGCPGGIGKTELYTIQPKYECFLDNFDITKYSGQSGFVDAMYEKRCSYLYEKKKGYAKNIFKSTANWATYLQPVAMTLPGKTVLVVAGGQFIGDSIKLLDLDPVINNKNIFGNSPEPELLKLVESPRYKYLSFFAISDDKFCGNFTNIGGWHSALQCWMIKHFPKSKKITSDEIALFPLGAINPPRKIHHEFIFSRTMSENKRYPVGGDKNVMVLNLNNSIFSKACSIFASERALSLKSSTSVLDISNLYDLYPSGFFQGHEAIYNSPCSVLYKTIEGSIYDNTSLDIPERQPDPNLPGLIGVFYPSYATWPIDTPSINNAGTLSLMGEWLTGAKLFYYQNGIIKYKHISHLSDYPSVAWAMLNHSGSLLYIIPQYANFAEKYTVSYTFGSEPEVRYEENVSIGEVIYLSGGFYDDATEKNSTRYAVIGSQSGAVSSPESADITFFNTEGGIIEKRISNYRLRNFIDVPSRFTFLTMRSGGYIGNYYYAPISVKSSEESGANERVYLATIDMDEVLNAPGIEVPESAIKSVIPLNPNTVDGSVTFDGMVDRELSHALRVDSHKNIGVFITWNIYSQNMNHPTFAGVIVDLALISNGVRTTSPSHTPSVVRSFYDDWSQARDISIFNLNGKQYKVGFNINGYTHNGCWYMRDTINKAVVVYDPIIRKNYDPSDPYRIDFQRIGVYDHEYDFHRHIVFLNNRGTAINHSGGFSFTLADCR